MAEPAALFRRLLGSLAAGWLLLAAVVPAFGQDPAAAPAVSPAAEFTARFTAWQAVLNQAATRIAAGDLDTAAYEALRRDLTRVQAEAREAGAAAAGGRDGMRPLLLSLGSPPAGDQAPEAAAVAAERKRLTDAMAEVEGRGKQADLILTRSGILLRTAADQRMTRLTEHLRRRSPMPLSPTTWAEVPEQAAYVQERIGHAVDAVIAQPGWRGRLSKLAAIAAVLALLALPVRRLLRRRFGYSPGPERPRYRERMMRMAIEAVAGALVTVAPTVAVTASLLGVLRDVPDAGPVSALVPSIAGGIVAFFLATGVARGTLVPGHPEWQLADITPDRARPLVRRITVAATGLTVAGTGISLSEGMFTPPELRSVVGLATMALIVASLWTVLPGRLWVVAPQAEPDARRTAWPRVRLAVGAVAALSLVAAALGYLAAAVYASKLMLAGVIVAGVLHAVRGVLREMWCALLERRGGLLAEVGDTIAEPGMGRRYLNHAGWVVIDGALFVVAALALLPLTGTSVSEMADVADTVFGGVVIAGVRVAPASVLKAAVALATMTAATRFLQRHLDGWFLARLSLDIGLRNSIRTGVGYLGATLAVLVAVGILGLDLSNLAMIASALSVGIGFGLQNIVGNFIAGLVMLVERPVKVGDWVVVDGVEGVVRRISVRATEVRTFQGASLVIPNSEFISKAVVNWTLLDRTTRVEIKVGVGYDADARLVHDLLLRIAQEHPHVLRDPPPVVAFRDFGASALQFELRFFLADTEIIQTVRNDVRMQILETFRAQRIEIPYEQRVVHMPRVEALLEDLLAARDTASSIAPAEPAPSKRAGPIRNVSGKKRVLIE
ncbi:DUF3772 domain-containing protein [Azospirillum sp. TSO22-1]|uniref:DUF3772 domain-containing protein n=1 Tax=Azospirillum sp. TSO22-1 TaxID=716789 RepID=UPI000D6116EA|nr:DUF3772 domain-containing protein [Azospirillum sp. TSO22-1]PWC54819.1 hypothetical protein TSO221_06850 [Azospirillum sp. TSO22-1]